MSTRYALLIGVDFYFPNELPEGGYGPLGGCVRDIRHVEAFLTCQFDLPPEQIFKLTASNCGGSQPLEPPEQWPTYENMVAKFQALTALAQRGDHVYIHYAGHGGRAATIFPELKGEGGLDEALVPTDIGDASARYLRDVELAYLFKRLVDRGVILTVVLDSCHSGGATRGTAVPRGGVIDPTPRPSDSLVAPHADLIALWQAQTRSVTRAVKPASGWLAEPQGYTLLAACRANELAYEDSFDGKERNGALTYWLLDSLRQLGPGAAYKTLHERVLAKIRTRFAAQTPQLQGAGNLVLFASERVQSRYAIPVLQVDAAGGRVALNAGEVHGLQVGSLLAVYPPGVTEFAPQQRRALVEVSQLVGDADAWARILPDSVTGELQEGGQALLLGGVGLGLQRSVALVPQTESARQVISAAIEAHGAGFLRLAAMGEPVDFQVGTNAAGTEYALCDAAGTPIANLRPPVAVDDADAAERLVKRLVHLAKYRAVQALENPEPGMKDKLEVELVGVSAPTESGHAPTYKPGERVTLHIHNRLPPNPHDRNDPTRILNVTVLDLQSDWAVTQIYPVGAGASEILQPGQSISLPFETFLPEGYTESVDIFKVFATQQTTNFRWLELPALDQPAPPRPVSRDALIDPLERLLAALTDDQAPTPADLRTRAIRLLSMPTTQKSWAIAQVELRVGQ